METEKSPSRFTERGMTAAALSVALLGITGLVLTTYFRFAELAFNDLASATISIGTLIGLSGFVFVWFCLITGPFTDGNAPENTFWRTAHALVGLAAALMVVLEPVLRAIAFGPRTLISAAPGLTAYAIGYDVAIALTIAWSVMTILAKYRNGRMSMVAHALNFTAFFGLLAYWRMIGNLANYWPGNWIWYAFAVSFSITVAWRMIPTDKEAT